MTLYVCIISCENNLLNCAANCYSVFTVFQETVLCLSAQGELSGVTTLEYPRELSGATTAALEYLLRSSTGEWRNVVV